MRTTIQNAEWSAEGLYTPKTKTLWALAASLCGASLTKGEKFSKNDIDYLTKRMKAIFGKANRNSISSYLGAFNGSIMGQRLVENKSYQNEVNSFRKKLGFSKIY